MQKQNPFLFRRFHHDQKKFVITVELRKAARGIFNQLFSLRSRSTTSVVTQRDGVRLAN